MMSISKISAVVKGMHSLMKKFTFANMLPQFLLATRFNHNRVANKNCGNDESIQPAGTLSFRYFEGITTVPASPQE